MQYRRIPGVQMCKGLMGQDRLSDYLYPRRCGETIKSQVTDAQAELLNQMEAKEEYIRYHVHVSNDILYTYHSNIFAKARIRSKGTDI